jgi:anti-sigma B factor antagonist
VSTSVARLRVEPAPPRGAVIVMAGDITAACADDLLAAHQEATDSGAAVVVLDFGEMAYMNSGGIGMLVTLLVRGQRRQQRIAAVGLTPHYRQIFELTRLDEAIGLFEDRAAALAAR